MLTQGVEALLASSWQRAVAVLSVACFLVTSCTSLEMVSVPDASSPPALPAVKVGDTVIITTKAKKKERFEVTAVEADALLGKRLRIAYADMVTLGIEHYRKGANIALAVAVAFTIYLVIAAKSLEDGLEETLNYPN